MPGPMQAFANYIPGLNGPGYTPQNPQSAQMGGAQFTEDYFTYSLAVGTLTTLATSNLTINIQADSAFDWIMSTYSGNLNGNSEPWTDAYILPVTVQISDGGSGRQLLSAATPVSSIAGTGKQPFILPVTRRFMPKSTVTFTFTSYSASTWNNIFFNLIGRKVFELG